MKTLINKESDSIILQRFQALADALFDFENAIDDIEEMSPLQMESIDPWTLNGQIMKDESVFPSDLIDQKTNMLAFTVSQDCISRHGLTGQEYEVFSAAYAKALRVLEKDLGLVGRIVTFID